MFAVESSFLVRGIVAAEGLRAKDQHCAIALHGDPRRLAHFNSRRGQVAGHHALAGLRHRLASPVFRLS